MKALFGLVVVTAVVFSNGVNADAIDLFAGSATELFSAFAGR